MLCWAHLNAKMMDAHRAWRSMLVSAGDIIFRSAVPEELYICMGTCGYVSYLWPIVTRTIRHATVFDYMTGNITHLKRDVVLNLEDWQWLPSKTISPLHLYILAERTMVPNLPSTSLAQTGHAVTLIQKCASTGLKGWNRAMLLRLDREKLDAVKDETTTAEIRFAMVAKALNLTETKAAGVLEPLAFNSDLEAKKAMLESEAFGDILSDARENERKGLLSDLQDETDGDVEELKELWKTFLVKPKDAKSKSKRAEKVWPKPSEALSADEFGSNLLAPTVGMTRCCSATKCFTKDPLALELCECSPLIVPPQRSPNGRGRTIWPLTARTRRQRDCWRLEDGRHRLRLVLYMILSVAREFGWHFFFFAGFFKESDVPLAVSEAATVTGGLSGKSNRPHQILN